MTEWFNGFILRLSIKYLQTKSGLTKEKVQKFTQLLQKKIEEAEQVLQENGNGNEK
jgi:hypothetical protein